MLCMTIKAPPLGSGGVQTTGIEENQRLLLKSELLDVPVD